MGTQLTTQLLKRFTPLDSLKRQNLDALSRKTQITAVDEGRIILKQGDTDQRLIYLVSGTVMLTAADGTNHVIEHNTDAARKPISEALPRQHTVTAATAVEYISLDADLLDVMLTWDQTGTYEVSDLGLIDEEPSKDQWMTVLLQTRAFQKIPPSNIQAIFMRMQQITYSAGDVIIRQGDEGDFFYVITAGQCAVTRETPLNRDGIRLAELAMGDTFGEEALISSNKRNATVSMLTDGSVMRLSKTDFHDLLKEPTIDKVDYKEAQDIVADGGQWLDVRLPSEFTDSHESEAINIPLYFIRLKLNTLDPDTRYVVYCDTGRRSSAATFILSEKGFNACVLEDGIKSANS
jgi:CRP-like cAMP-binding protein/rhodanese-related sulfurtransferase